MSETPAQRAEHARQLLEDELLSGAFDLVEQLILTAWEQTGHAHTELRESCYRHYKAAKQVRGIIDKYLREGSEAAALDLHRRLGVSRVA